MRESGEFIYFISVRLFIVTDVAALTRDTRSSQSAAVQNVIKMLKYC